MQHFLKELQVAIPQYRWEATDNPNRFTARIGGKEDGFFFVNLHSRGPMFVASIMYSFPKSVVPFTATTLEFCINTLAGDTPQATSKAVAEHLAKYVAYLLIHPDRTDS